MPVTPSGQTYSSVREHFEKFAYQVAPASIPVGSAAWYAHGNYQGANQGGEHGSYGWRHADLASTEAGQRAILSRNAAMPDKYLLGPTDPRGLGDWVYTLTGRNVGDLGRPLGWKWGDENATALDDNAATNMDGSHCRYGPLFEILRPESPSFPITATLPIYGFPATLSSKDWAAILVLFGVRTFAGQLRHPYLWSEANLATNEPDRHNVLILDFMAQAARHGVCVAQDADAAAHHLGKTLKAFQLGCGAHGEPRPEVGGLWAFQTLDCLCYAPACLYWTSTLPGMAQGLVDQLREIARKRSVAHVQAWSPGQPYPYWVGVPGGPSTPMDQITGMVTWPDPLVLHGYEPWAYSSYRVGEELGVTGCAERAEWIADHWKADAHARQRYLVEPDRSLLYP